MSINYLRALRAFVFLAILAGCGGGSDDGSSSRVPDQATSPPAVGGSTMPALALQLVATGLSSPLFLTSPSADARLFIVERPGRIRIVQEGALLPTAFLDIRNRTTVDGERGLLSDRKSVV